MLRCRIFFVLIVGLLSFDAQAAGPVMHIILGQQWLNVYAPDYTEEEKKLFLLGTVFPDIRYLGVIKREQSHFKGVTLQKVLKANNPFQRGMLFHSFVDEYREKFVHRVAIEKKISGVPTQWRGTLLKLVEDQLLHEKYNWSQIKMFLGTIPEEEKNFGIEAHALTQWHTGLAFYFSATPSFILTQLSLFDQGILSLDAEQVKLWSTLIPQYAGDSHFQKYVDNLLKAFDKEIASKR